MGRLSVDETSNASYDFLDDSFLGVYLKNRREVLEYLRPSDEVSKPGI